MMFKSKLVIFLVSLSFFWGNAFSFANENDTQIGLWLSWHKDPSTTMNIKWLTKKEDRNSHLEYREVNKLIWKGALVQEIKMPYDLPYVIHYVEIKGLTPNTVYEFTIDDKETYLFKTLPNSLATPIKFVVGGDMYHDDIEVVRETQRAAASNSPSFAILGGDLAYSAPKVGHFKEEFEKWVDFLRAWKETMITKEGYLIPMVTAIGNHEVIGRYGQSKAEAVFYYAFFAAPNGSTNYTLDFGNYLSLIILDSGHTFDISGEQTEWLEQSLKDRLCVPHKFAVYHVPAWPSIRKFEYKVSKEIRANWVPLFEKYRINAAFEHHDHGYKRSHPIYEGQIDQNKGVLYLGDGAWGVKKPRLPKTKEPRWWIAKSLPERHFFLVTLKGCVRNYKGINSDGVIFDEVTR